MAEPVLVIHGVGNPQPEPFRAVVAGLQNVVGADFELIDVFWGDLGASRVGFEDTVPGPGDTGDEQTVARAAAPDALVLSPPDGVVGGVTTDPERAAVIAAAAQPTELETPDPVLQALILEELQQTVYLRSLTNPEVLVALGELIATGAAVPEAGDAERAFGSLGGGLGGIMKEVDRLVGAAVGEALGRFNEALRKQLVPVVAGFLGDVFAYEHHRAAIQGRIWQAIDERAPGWGTAEKPIDVVAHSLGGVVMFHAATTGETGRTLAIDRFVTFGSQASLFHCVDPQRSGLAPYSPGQPVPVHTIRRWTNLWEPLDPLAFLAGKVFVLEDGTGVRTAPDDVPVRHLTESGFFTHGSYWRSEELAGAIRAPA